MNREIARLTRHRIFQKFKEIKIREEVLNDELASNFIGRMGSVPGVDPLGPDNVLLERGYSF